MKKILAAFCLICLVLLALLTSLLVTERGLKSMFFVAQKMTDSFRIESVQGRLLTGFNAKNLKIVSGENRVLIDTFQFSWNPTKLALKTLQVGKLRLSGIQIHTATRSDEQNEDSGEELTLPDILLPISIVLGEIEVLGLEFFDNNIKSGQIDRIFLKGKARGSNIDLQQFYISAPNFIFDVAGKTTANGNWPLELSGSWQLNFEEYSEMGGKFKVGGELNGLDVYAKAERPVVVEVEGKLKNILIEQKWTATITQAKGILSKVHPSWPDIDLDIHGEARGDFSVYGGELKAKAHWYDLVGLTLEDIDVETHLLGGVHGIDFHKVSLQRQGGSVEATGEIGWVDEFFWKAEGVLGNMNPSGFSVPIEGSLSGAVTSSGEVGDGGLRLDVGVQGMEGSLRDYPVIGSGFFEYDDGRMELKDVFFASGESVVSVSGHITDSIALDFNVVSVNISELYPGANGQVRMTGSLGGVLEYPEIESEIHAENLSFQDYSIQHLAGDVFLSQSGLGTVRGMIDATGIKLGAHDIDSLQLAAIGEQHQHKVDISLSSDAIKSDMAIVGTLEGKTWQGQINRFDTDILNIVNWELRNQALILLAPEKVAVTDLCLANINGGLCGELSLASDGVWQGAVFSDGYSIGFLNDLELLPFALSGRLVLSLESAGVAQTMNHLDLSASLLGSSIVFEDEEEKLTLEWVENKLQANLVDKELHVDYSSIFKDEGRLSTSLKLVGFEKLSEDILHNELLGKIRLELNSLEYLSGFTDYIVKPKGRLAGEFEISGTLFRPLLDGGMQTEDASIDIPLLGITLENLELGVEAKHPQIGLGFKTTMGEGTLSANGMFVYDEEDGWIGKAILDGENALVANTSEYKIIVDPELNFEVSQKGGLLTGSIRIPSAAISPETFSSSIAESNDVEYLDLSESEKVSDWPLTSKIRVEAGDDVLIDTSGLYGYLSGAINLRDEPKKPVTADGQLFLREGLFSVYGRSLVIERGRVFFTGGPIDNPLLDIRAQRSVDDLQAGVNGGWTVGVDVTGSVEDMKVDLFSDPPMDDSDILAYMVVGRSASDSDNEGGLLASAATAIGIGGSADFVDSVGNLLSLDEMHIEGGSATEEASLVVGKNITDKIYVGYDYNLFKSDGQLIIRYMLGKGFYIETQSSSYSNGADIFYSFDK